MYAGDVNLTKFSIEEQYDDNMKILRIKNEQTVISQTGRCLSVGRHLSAFRALFPVLEAGIDVRRVAERLVL